MNRKENLWGLLGPWIFWILLGSFYVLRTPGGAFTHDFQGHLTYTHIVAFDHRLPSPGEGWETYQPPLYYWINSILAGHRAHHVFWIRLASVNYGLWMLAVLGYALYRQGVKPSTQAAILLFISTTPAFVFLFGSYNNDSLSTFLSVLTIVLAWEVARHGRKMTATTLTLIAALGLYTKLTLFYPIAAMGILTMILALQKKIAKRNAILVLIALLISVLSLTPWVYGHNYFFTGQWFPSPADQPLCDQLRLLHKPLKTLLMPPVWTPGKWGDPFANLWDLPHTKKDSFLAYLFSTSVFGEFSFGFMKPVVLWSMVWIHAGLWIYALANARRTPTATLAMSLMILGTLAFASLIFHAPYASLMDFRYIAWCWFPTGLLYGEILGHHPNSRIVLTLDHFVLGSLWFGILMHLTLLGSLFIGGQRWYF